MTNAMWYVWKRQKKNKRRQMPYSEAEDEWQVYMGIGYVRRESALTKAQQARSLFPAHVFRVAREEPPV